MKLTARDFILELKINIAAKALLIMMKFGTKKLSYFALDKYMKLRNSRRQEVVEAMEIELLKSICGVK